MDLIARFGFTFSLLLLLLLPSPFTFSVSSLPQRHLLQLSSQSPQNLQTFPSTAIPAFINPPRSPPPPPLSPPPPPASTPSDSDKGNIAAAVIGTAASSFALYGFLFFAFYWFTKKKRRGPETRVCSSDGAAGVGGGANTFRSKPEPTIKGVIVDDNGLDVLYWRNLEDTARRRCDHCNSIVDRGRYMDEDEATGSPEPRRRRRVKGEVMTQETPLLPTDSVNSSSQVFAQSRPTNRSSSGSIASFEPSHSPPAAPPPAKFQPPPPPPPPAPPKPRTPPAPLIKNAPAPPPPPARRVAAAPAPQLGPDGGTERPRLKPLHWEKVTPTRAGHSMVWDRINDGSIKFDDDQMEALFGYVSTNPNPPKSNSGESSTSTSISTAAAVPSQISLLDARKSQNIAIILRTLAVSRHEILESLHHGHGLSADTLEKLCRITLTKDEESLFISFSGNPVHLTDAESFLFHLLQTFPSAFPRILAMHFRSCVYNPEILHLKQSLLTLELACKELRTRGLFLKLLEAILKAGNRMNAGTVRGNAQAFDLTALRKLSDVKSTDGKTTLLHFVVEEVVRSEGKRCAAINGNLPEAGEEREREFIILGLPVVGGLSSEFMNVKAAATLDPDSMAASCSTMAERVIDIRKFLRNCEEKEEGFVREMMGFVETAGKEMEEVKEEQWRVMEIVKRTLEYYQLGTALKEKEGKLSLQIFVIVRDFLAMVDQACTDISRNIQKRKTQTPLEKEKRITARFPNLPARFMADNSVSCSDSDDEF